MRRTNEEFKAEILSRSDKIIKKRKRAKRIVMCCVPLLLCSFIGIYALALGGVTKGSSERLDGGIGNILDVNNDNSFSKEDAAAPEVSVEMDGADETLMAGDTTMAGAVAVTVQSIEKGISSHVNDKNAAVKLYELISNVVEEKAFCEKSAQVEYAVTIHFENNTIKSYSIAGNALICGNEIYLIDNTWYDSILQLVKRIAA